MTRLPEELQRIADLQPGRQTNGRWRIDPRLALSIVGWLVTIALAWGGFNARLAVVEVQQQENERRMQRLEEKIDLLLGRR